MVLKNYSAKANEYMKKFCSEIGSRPIGSTPNILATDYFLKELSLLGFSTAKQVFDCIEWKYGDVSLKAENKELKSFVSPCSPSFRGERELAAASSLEELHRTNTGDKILLLYGDIAREQLMPKNFPFYNPEAHQEVVRIIEKQNPAAIIAMTAKNPELAGALYSFPLFEDGDFDIPSIYI